MYVFSVKEPIWNKKDFDRQVRKAEFQKRKIRYSVRYFHKSLIIGIDCGETGIRTLGTREGTTVFETAPIDRSGISPLHLFLTLHKRFHRIGINLQQILPHLNITNIL